MRAACFFGFIKILPRDFPSLIYKYIYYVNIFMCVGLKLYPADGFVSLNIMKYP